MIELLPLLFFLPYLVASAVIAVLAGWAVWRSWPYLAGESVSCDICRGEVPARQAREHRRACADLTSHRLWEVDRTLLLLGLQPGEELEGVPLARYQVDALADRVVRHYARAERISR